MSGFRSWGCVAADVGVSGLWLTGCCVAEEERRVRANAREYNEKFQYAVSEGWGLNCFPGVLGQVCAAGV